MTNIKIVFTALLMALALGGPVLGQDLDGTLKKIKTFGYIYDRLPATPRPPSLFQGRTSVRWVIPLMSACRSQAPFKSSWGWRISSSIGCR